MKISKYQSDLLERVFWTAAQAAVAVFAIHAASIDPLWAVPVASTLAVVKGLIAKRIGENNAALPLWAQQGITDATERAIEAVLPPGKTKRLK